MDGASSADRRAEDQAKRAEQEASEASQSAKVSAAVLTAAKIAAKSSTDLQKAAGGHAADSKKHEDDSEKVLENA